MLFNSYIFLFVFLPVVYLGYLFLRRFEDHRVALTWLIVASLVYYGWGGILFFKILICMMVVNATIGQLNLVRFGLPRKLLLVLGVGANLVLLGYFKYASFAITSLNETVGTDIQILQIALPIGISFYTFQNIAFQVDVYRGYVQRFSFVEYFFFISFFPQLIAGPIVHHAEIIPHARESVRRRSFDDFCIGFSIFCIGLFKKVVVADNCAVYAQAGYDMVAAGQPLDPASAWASVVAYSFQIYYDFSGYSDMAIGLARMFGFVLPINFFSPYRSVNIVEFWRRWHITLSRFLRDYLYAPLGGGRVGPVRQIRNLLAVMLLGGLWHGAAWTFVAWGTIHGTLLGMTHLLLRSPLGRMQIMESPPLRMAGMLITFFLVTLAWVPFRAPSFADASQMLGHLFPLDMSAGEIWHSFAAIGEELRSVASTLNPTMWAPARELWPAVLPPDFIATARPVWVWLLAVALWTFLMPNTVQLFERFSPALGLTNYPAKVRLSLARLSTAAGVAIGGIFLISVLFHSRISPFLYFQF